MCRQIKQDTNPNTFTRLSETNNKVFETTKTQETLTGSVLRDPDHGQLTNPDMATNKSSYYAFFSLFSLAESQPHDLQII